MANNSDQNIKRNLMLVIFLITILFSIIITLHQNNLIKENFKNEMNTFDENVHRAFNVILNNLSHDMSMSSSGILEKKGLVKSFFDKDRDKLKDIVIPFYKRMSEQNPYFKIMTFRSADGTVFLRAHKLEMFGDVLSQKRKIIIDTNRLKKIHFGFEVGKLKITYRIVTPIFYEKEYIGSLEIGIEPEYVTNKLNKLFKVNNALLVKKENMSILLEKNQHQSISDFILIRGDELFSKHLQEINLDKETMITTDGDKSYIVDSDLNLLDHKNKVAAKILLAYNIDKYLLNIDRVTKDIIIYMLIIMVLLMFILNYFIGFFIKEINELNLTLVGDRKRAEYELAELKRTLEEKIKLGTLDLKKAQSLAQIGSWIVDVKDNSLTWSDETYNIFEIDRSLNPNISLEDFFGAIHPDDLQKVSDAYTNHLENREPYTITHRLLFEDGMIKYVEERCETTFDENGNALISTGTVQDITKGKETQFRLQQKEQQLIQQSRLAQMGEMISMIAHQWRQPLNAISLTSSNLQLRCIMGEMDEDVFQAELEHIGEYSQHLSKTIDDFRGFFKENKIKEVSTLKDIVNSTLGIVQTSIESKGIAIVTELQCNKEFEIYLSEMKQVILNIIKNAEDILLENKIKNPTITIKALCDENKKNMQLIIKDNGGGIPSDIIEKIFDPYFSTKLEKDGTGLGLYMSKTIIEEHCNGKLSVFNDQYGAVFKIEL